MFKRGRSNQSRGPSLLGAGPQDNQRHGQMSVGMQKMIGVSGNRVGLLGSGPSNTMGNSGYQPQQQYDQSYDDDYGDYGTADNSMYGGQSNTQSMYRGQQGQRLQNPRQGLLGQVPGQSGMGAMNMSQGHADDYYDDQDYGDQGYGVDQSTDDWGNGDDQMGWDYGEEQQVGGNGLLETPRLSGVGQGFSSMGPRSGLLGNPPYSRGQGLLATPTGRGQLNQGMNQGQSLMEHQRNQGLNQGQSMMERQSDLMKKADLQMRMIQEEKRDEERRQKELMQQGRVHMDELRRAKEMQTLLENQKRALMLQQKENQMRMGDGLLGDRPLPGGQTGGLKQSVDIPSIFEINNPPRSSLGKRPNATVVRAAQASKRARKESQISRNRPENKPRRSSPSRRHSSRDGSRRSRFESNSRSKQRDRKDSDRQKSSSSQMSKSSSSKEHSHTKSRESREEKITKETTEVTVTTAGDNDLARPSGDSKEVSTKKDEKDKNLKVEDMVIDHEKKDETGNKDEEEKQMETTLTVTVSKKGRSVNDSDAKGDQTEREKKYKCSLCDVKCYDEHSFSRHMNGVKHQKKMGMLPTGTTATSPLQAARKIAEKHLREIESKRKGGPEKSLSAGNAQKSLCKVCNEMFSGAYKDHKEAPKHKAKEDRSKAGCKVCNVTTFNTYQNFRKHLESDWHKKNKKKRGETEEDHPEDLGDLVTLDTVGFEEESNLDTSKEVEKEKEPVKPVVKEKEESVSRRKVSEEEDEILGEYDPNIAVGQKFVVPVSGFFCKLCHKFYNNESAAKGSHCQSQSHFEKYQKLVIAKMMNRKLSEENISKKSVKQEKTEESTLTETLMAGTSAPLKHDDNTTVVSPNEKQSRNLFDSLDQSVKQLNADIQSANNNAETVANGDTNDSIEEQTDKSSQVTEDMDTSTTEDKSDDKPDDKPDNKPDDKPDDKLEDKLEDKDNEIHIEVFPETKLSSPRRSGPKARRGRKLKK